MNVSKKIKSAKRLTRNAFRAETWQQSIGTVTRRLGVQPETTFSDLITNYNVIIMKHCFLSSDILEDTGKADPASPRQSLENYQAVYRLLREKFDAYLNTLFIVWTLPPRHRLFKPSEGSKEENAARAAVFSNWLKGEFIAEGGPHPNIYIWDFRGITAESDANYLKYEYESDHNGSNSHPNEFANNYTGPKFGQFVINSITDFNGSETWRQTARIVFLCHSTGQHLYEYSDLGLKIWFANYNAESGTNISIKKLWYPSAGNMPVHYYRSWLAN